MNAPKEDVDPIGIVPIQIDLVDASASSQDEMLSILAQKGLLTVAQAEMSVSDRPAENVRKEAIVPVVPPAGQEETKKPQDISLPVPSSPNQERSSLTKPTKNSGKEALRVTAIIPDVPPASYEEPTKPKDVKISMPGPEQILHVEGSNAAGEYYDRNPTPTPPEAPALSRRQEDVGATFHMSQPGAFATRPGRNSSRQVAVQFSLFRNDTDSTGSAEEPEDVSSVSSASTQDHPPQLLEARAVDEDEEKALPGAIPVDLDDGNKSEEMVRRTERQKKLGLLGFLLILVTVTSVSVIAGTSHPNNVTPTKPLPPIYSPAPTVPPTSSPTADPFILHGLVSNKSVEAIKTPLSPQYKAYEWLVNHPDIANMTDWRKMQLLALSTFFYSFHGDEWLDIIRDDWLVHEESECLWYSNIFATVAYGMREQKYVLFPVTTNETSCNEDGRFTRLNLFLKGQMATIEPAHMPPEIAMLSDLEEILMGFIEVNGPLLYGLSHLSTLDFSRTALTGSLAPQLGRWTQMKELKISANLSGTIPSTISDLLWLETVDLRNNRLSGSLPILTNSDNLRRLDLSNNKFTGSITANMFANQEWRESLDFLRLDNNYLTGSLPDDLWNLTSLKVVYLGNNVDLSGSLPASKLVSFPFLAYFNLSHGSFYGSVPFAAFSNNSGGMLNSLVLNGNQFSGSISSEVGLLTRLSQLNLADNGMLNGSIPVELGNCTWVKSLELQGNAFSGSIPTHLGKLRFMNIFNLSNNTEIGGQIPSELGLLTRLHSLVLDGTSLSGSVPEEVCLLQNDTIGSLIELRVNCSSVTCSCNCTCVG